MEQEEEDGEEEITKFTNQPSVAQPDLRIDL